MGWHLIDVNHRGQQRHVAVELMCIVSETGIAGGYSDSCCHHAIAFATQQGLKPTQSALSVFEIKRVVAVKNKRDLQKLAFQPTRQ